MSDTLQYFLNSQEHSHQVDKAPSLGGVKVRSLPKTERPNSEADQKPSEDLSQVESLTIERSSDPKIQVKNIYSFIEKSVMAPHITALLKQISKSQFQSVRRFISSGEGAPILSLFESKNEILNKTDDSMLFALEDTDVKPLGILNRIVKETATLLRAQKLEDYLGISIHSVQEAESRYSSLYSALHETSSSNPDQSTIAKNLLSQLMVDFRKKGGDELQNAIGSETESDLVPVENTSDEVAVIDNTIPLSSTYFIRENLRDEQPQEVQPWLDQGREEDFKKITQFFSELEDMDKSRIVFHQWLVDQFNLSLVEGKKLEIVDVNSVILRVVKAVEAGEVAGQDVERPIITFLDRKQYFSFMERLSGGEAGSAAYMQFTGNNENIFVRSGLIFASRLNDMEFAHEIRHTIDPFVKTRTGTDQILTEAFAFFQANHEDKDAYIKLLSHYYDDFGKKDTGEMMPKDEFIALVQKVVEKVLALSSKSDSLSAQRQLVQCQTLEELFAL